CSCPSCTPAEATTSNLGTLRVVVVAQVLVVCFAACAPPVAFVPIAFVLVCVSAAVALLAFDAPVPFAVSVPHLRVVPQPCHVPVLAGAAAFGVPVPAGRVIAPALAAAFFLNWG